MTFSIYNLNIKYIILNNLVINLNVSNIYIGEGNDTLLQYSCLENPMGRGAW